MTVVAKASSDSSDSNNKGFQGINSSSQDVTKTNIDSTGSKSQANI